MTWWSCDDRFLFLNSAKTRLKISVAITKEKERSSSHLSSGYFDQSIDVVSQYRYLGTLIDSKLTFELQTAHQHLYLYQKLHDFNLFQTCFIKSVLTFSCVCCYGLITQKQTTIIGFLILFEYVTRLQVWYNKIWISWTDTHTHSKYALVNLPDKVILPVDFNLYGACFFSARWLSRAKSMLHWPTWLWHQRCVQTWWRPPVQLWMYCWFHWRWTLLFW